YATATGANQLAVIDGASGAVVARVPTGDYPDGLAYDPDDRKVFVSNERGGTVTVVDATTNRRVADVELGGDTGNTQYDGRPRRPPTSSRSMRRPTWSTCRSRTSTAGRSCASWPRPTGDAPRSRAHSRRCRASATRWAPRIRSRAQDRSPRGCPGTRSCRTGA